MVPSGRGEGGVLNLSDLQLRGVVAGDVLHRLEGALAGDFDFAHVGDVEQPGGGAHRVMFRGDAGVFDRHVPTAEGHHARAEGDVGRVQRGFLERSVCGVGH